MTVYQDIMNAIKKTYDDGISLIEKKNADYAKSDDFFRNFRSASIVGLNPDRAMLVRILDKIARVSNLLDNQAQVGDEAITDTVLDAINYLAILKAYLEHEKLISVAIGVPTGSGGTGFAIAAGQMLTPTSAPSIF